MEDSFFDSMVAKALDIKKSGRWAAFNEGIITLSKSCENYKAWRATVFANVSATVLGEFIQLKKAYEDERGDISLVAWRTRNLLELSMWSIYITKSEENAKKFSDDATRDTLDIIDAYTKWGVTTKQHKDWLDGFHRAKEDIKQKAQAQEVEDMEGAYQRVNQVAEMLGMGQHFKIAYKKLSKHAHPTAMHVLGPLHDKELTDAMKKLFYEEGCFYFHDTFVILEEHLQLVINEL